MIPEGAKAVEPLNKTFILRAICSENKDSARRKFNVIVTGLEPDRRDNDVTIFSKLCYDHLSINIDSDINQALSRRLGSPTNGKIQKLLIVMKSESAANAILHGAKELRRSGDMRVASSVFINANLTPTEATLAYEGRVKRRESLKLQHPQSNVLSTLHVLHSAPSDLQSFIVPVELMDAVEGPSNPCPDPIDVSQLVPNYISSHLNDVDNLVNLISLPSLNSVNQNSVPRVTVNPKSVRPSHPYINLAVHSVQPNHGLFKCLFFNARSLCNKIGELNDLIHTSIPSIIGICETRLNDTVSSAMLDPNNHYSVFRNDRTTRGGGVCLFIDKNFKCLQVLVVLSDLPGVEIVCADIINLRSWTRIIVCYRSTSLSKESLATNSGLITCLALDRLCNVNYSVILLGYFNLPGIDWNSHKLPPDPIQLSFFEFFYSSGLVQLNFLPSRNNAILDLILTTETNLISDINSSSHRR